MADQQEEEDLQMALRMSLQAAPPEAKRSKPPEGAEESPEVRGRRLRREIMAAAVERRIAVSRVAEVGGLPCRDGAERECCYCCSSCSCCCGVCENGGSRGSAGRGRYRDGKCKNEGDW